MSGNTFLRYIPGSWRPQSGKQKYIWFSFLPGDFLPIILNGQPRGIFPSWPLQNSLLERPCTSQERDSLFPSLGPSAPSAGQWYLLASFSDH